jgi:hypothetical protein
MNDQFISTLSSTLFELLPLAKRELLERSRGSGPNNQQTFFKSYDQALFPDRKTFNDRK